MAKRATRRASNGTMNHRHGQDRGRCLRILRKLSAYLDDELSDTICGEIRRHLGACPNCEDFVASLRQTVALCRHKPVPPLLAGDRARMREAILLAARSR